MSYYAEVSQDQTPPHYLDDNTIIPQAVIETNHIDPNAFDSVLAQELNHLSMKERNCIIQEIHGVADPIQEDSMIISKSLLELETSIQQLLQLDLEEEQQQQQQQHIIRSGADAYRMAYEMNPKWITSSKFRLQFLRADKFNCFAAAKRILRYFQQKYLLFCNGNKERDNKNISLLGKEHITLQDLNSNDLIALQCGYMQWLPVRDNSERSIYFAAIPLRQWKERSNLLRALWYLLNVAVQDEETQKHGIVLLCYLMGYNHAKAAADATTMTTTGTGTSSSRPPLDRQAAYYLANLFISIPIRVDTIHFCCEHVPTLLAIKLLLLITGKESRIRTRCHFGSRIEVFYALSSFGIPVNSIPVLPNGEFDMKPHTSWIESRRQAEQQEQQDGNEKEDDDDNDSAPLIQSFHSPIGFMESDTTKTTTTRGNEDDASNNTPPKEQQQQQRQLQSLKKPRKSTPAPLTETDEEVFPQPQDVLLGKLKLAKVQLGNEILDTLIGSYSMEYESCTTKSEKMKISKCIVNLIHTRGGRFLKQTKLKYGKDRRVHNNEAMIGWVEVPDSVAREKIGHSFRNLRLRGGGTATNSVSGGVPPPSLSSLSSSSSTTTPTTRTTKTSITTAKTAAAATANRTNNAVKANQFWNNKNTRIDLMGDNGDLGMASSRLSCKIPKSINGPSPAGNGWFCR